MYDMKPNETMGMLGFLLFVAGFINLLLNHSLAAIASIILGVLTMQVFLSWWGLETFNKWFYDIFK